MEPPRKPLRLLVIAPYAAYPPVGGGKLRIYHLVQEWMHLGHDVTLYMAPSDEPALGWSDGTPRPQLRALTAQTRGSTLAKLRALFSPLPDEVWARPPRPIDPDRSEIGRYDLAVLMQAHVGRYAAQMMRIGLPVILDQQNVESQISGMVARLAPTRMGRIRARIDIVKWESYERRLMRSVQRTVAVSELDAISLRQRVPSASVVVRPSGADLRSLAFVDHSENRGNRLIMTGTLGYLPNLDAARWMIDRILPRVRRTLPSVRLTLAGANAPDSLRERGAGTVEVVGRVSDVRPFLDHSDLFVAPLRAGGGTRLKLLEAFAVGLPVVATTIASAGIAVQHGQDVATGDDEAALAGQIVRLLTDVSVRRAQSESARRLVEEHYDWRSIAADYQEDLYDVARAGPRGFG